MTPPAEHGGASPSPDGVGAGPSTVAVRCWGTRGSIPSPGPTTAGYGGNTPCLELTVNGKRVIFDAGTGIRLLGTRMVQVRDTKDAVIFLTHFHWDHIQGFPFFAPVYDPSFSLRIIGPEQEGMDVETLFAGQMGPIYFPVPFEALSADLSFDHFNEGVWEEDGIRIHVMRMRHPSFTVGYRVEAGDRSIVFIPDNELVGGPFPTPARWREELEAFVAGADVLFHDAMFTEEEYRTYEGWGHSTYDQALELAARASVRRLFFFHHAPERSDAELNRILEGFRREVGDRGLDLEVHAAFEGKQILIEEV